LCLWSSVSGLGRKWLAIPSGRVPWRQRQWRTRKGRPLHPSPPRPSPPLLGSFGRSESSNSAAVARYRGSGGRRRQRREEEKERGDGFFLLRLRRRLSLRRSGREEKDPGRPLREEEAGGEGAPGKEAEEGPVGGAAGVGGPGGEGEGGPGDPPGWTKGPQRSGRAEVGPGAPLMERAEGLGAPGSGPGTTGMKGTPGGPRRKTWGRHRGPPLKWMRENSPGALLKWMAGPRQGGQEEEGLGLPQRKSSPGGALKWMRGPRPPRGKGEEEEGAGLLPKGGAGRGLGPPQRERAGAAPGNPPKGTAEGPPEREGREPSRGSPRRGISPTREVWAPPQEGLWGGPDPEMHRSSLPSSLGWEPHREAQRSRWGSPREEARQGLSARESRAPLRGLGPAKPWRGRSESPTEERERSHPPEKLRRILLGGPEGREGEQVPSGRSQMGQDSLEWLRRQQDPNRAWREGSGEHSYRSRYQPQLEAIGIGGQWSGLEAMEGELPGPSREEWDWDRPRWQTAEERDQYSPKWEEGRERFRGQSPLEQRGRGHLSHYDRESATESPHRQWHPEGHLASFQGGWGPRGGRVDKEIEQDWKKEEGHGGGEGDLNANTFTAGPPPVPKEWTPCEQVLSFWERCRTVLKKKTRRYMLSTCPRPTLPDRSSETPELNSSVSAMLKPQQQKEIACATRSLHSLQDEVLDMLGPAMTVYEMAEEALAKGEAVDPMELREWARCLVRFIGSINENLTLQRRVVVLGAIHPRLKCVTTKMTSQSTGGLLFAEDKVKLLKEIIKRFPQLAQNPQAPRRAHPFLRPPYSRRRVPVRSASRHSHSAEKPYRRSPADQHEEEHH
ncbi:collagen alpha-1(XI) chain-like, partial [Sceloporus undulatus]|uniref:collagen alpha-1(XI) chain-like n=1 Tax=Sceloporus undulatus TaxID=8520 RepID=UPI001C4BFF16